MSAFILNFAKFTEWMGPNAPERTGGLSLCMQGSRDDLMQALRALESRQVHGQTVSVRRVSRTDDMRTCHVLVIGDGPAPALGGLPGVLLVSDLPGFAQAGGHIGLLHIGSKLRFEVNRGSLSQAGLKVSSQLLSLAASVLDGPSVAGER